MAIPFTIPNAPITRAPIVDGVIGDPINLEPGAWINISAPSAVYARGNTVCVERHRVIFTFTLTSIDEALNWARSMAIRGRR